MHACVCVYVYLSIYGRVGEEVKSKGKGRWNMSIGEASRIRIHGDIHALLETSMTDQQWLPSNGEDLFICTVDPPNPLILSLPPLLTHKRTQIHPPLHLTLQQMYVPYDVPVLFSYRNA